MKSVVRTLPCSVTAALVLALALASPAMPAHGEQLIVKLRADAAKSARTPKAEIEKLSAAVGATLSHVREMALGAHVVAIVDRHGIAGAERIAREVAAQPTIEFAEVDHRRHALQAGPNDQLLTTQRYLTNDPTSISAFAAWEVTHGSAGVVVAVIDTGYRVHQDLAGRLLPGYDMISNAAVAADGDGRDPDPTDRGDFLLAGDLAGFFEGCDFSFSTWHGTGVAGIIAANPNNGVFMAGIDWNARILPVRVLGKCGGFDSDIVDGIAWAAGLAVPGVPANPTPAQVINLSLGASSPCRAVYPNVFGAVLGAGITKAIVVAAGNDAQDVANDTPAGCPGVIAVASTTSSGKLANYSNFGSGIAVSAPGGTIRFNLPDEGVFVLSNSGTTMPNEPSPFGDSFKSSGGTSFAAPMVAGTISLMLAVAPHLTPAQVRNIIITTAKPFPDGSDCTTERCGGGIVDAGAAVRAAAAVPPPATPAAATIVEFYNAALDHYFITHIAAEIAKLDAGTTIKGWVRTGQTFAVYAAAAAGTSPVCRFYIPPGLGDSHFYGRGSAECAATALNHPTFVDEDPQFFHVALPVAGDCPAGTREIYRVFSNRADANHRYTVSRAIRDQMVAAGWLAEGDGPNLVVMCGPA
jgi:serine protease